MGQAREKQPAGGRVEEDEAGELCRPRLGCGKELPQFLGKRLPNLPMESQELLLGSRGKCQDKEANFQTWETRRRSCPDTRRVGDSPDTHTERPRRPLGLGSGVGGEAGTGTWVSQVHSMKIFPPRPCRGFCKPPFKEISQDPANHPSSDRA